MHNVRFSCSFSSCYVCAIAYIVLILVEYFEILLNKTLFYELVLRFNIYKDVLLIQMFCTEFLLNVEPFYIAWVMNNH